MNTDIENTIKRLDSSLDPIRSLISELGLKSDKSRVALYEKLVNCWGCDSVEDVYDVFTSKDDFTSDLKPLWKIRLRDFFTKQHQARRQVKSNTFSSTPSNTIESTRFDGKTVDIDELDNNCIDAVTKKEKDQSSIREKDVNDNSYKLTMNDKSNLQMCDMEEDDNNNDSDTKNNNRNSNNVDDESAILNEKETDSLLNKVIDKNFNETKKTTNNNNNNNNNDDNNNFTVENAIEDSYDSPAKPKTLNIFAAAQNAAKIKVHFDPNTMASSHDATNPSMQTLRKVAYDAGDWPMKVLPDFVIQSAEQCLNEMPWHTHHESSAAFVLTSWNVLAQRYMSGHGYCPSQYSSWSYRRAMIVAYLQRLNSDIVCLQELQQAVKQFGGTTSHDHAVEVLDLLHAAGYETKYVRKESERPVDIGNVVAWRRSRFQCLSSRVVSYQSEIGAAIRQDQRYSTMSGRDTLEHLAYPQVAVGVRLRDQTTKKTVYVVTTHICSEPKNEERQLAQLVVLRNHIASVQEQEPSDAVVIAGDFNILADSSLARYVLGEQFTPADARRLLPAHLHWPTLLHLDHNPSLAQESQYSRQAATQALAASAPAWQSAYLNILGKELSFTTLKPRYLDRKAFEGVLDYVWLPQNQSLKVIDVRKMPSRKFITHQCGGIPNQFVPSDHLPIIVKLKFKSKPTRK